MCFLIKYGLFFANLVFSLAGLAFIGVGVAVLVTGADLFKLIPVNVEAIPITIIVLGSIIFLIAFFGCCGAITQNRCFLSMYAVIMLILAAGKLYIAVVIFRVMANIEDTVVEWLRESFAKNDLRNIFHAMEVTFRCCGTFGPRSYMGILPALPPSCCASDVQVCDELNAFEGCNYRVTDFFSKYGDSVGIVVVIIIAIELAAMIFALCVCQNARKRVA